MGLINSEDLIGEINKLIEEVNKTGVNLSERTAYFSCLTIIDRLNSKDYMMRARMVPAPELPKPRFFCQLCRADLKEDYNFCPNCGAKLIKEE